MANAIRLNEVRQLTLITGIQFLFNNVCYVVQCKLSVLPDSHCEI